MKDRELWSSVSGCLFRAVYGSFIVTLLAGAGCAGTRQVRTHLIVPPECQRFRADVCEIKGDAIQCKNQRIDYTCTKLETY